MRRTVCRDAGRGERQPRDVAAQGPQENRFRGRRAHGPLAEFTDVAHPECDL
ncbi:hypothetical protein [Streptomyces sp. enrichment culture]|uniref:hypothetical protein n=1 Tax=Streptomyces sp. enrichment culture TaxID=1795815 RepID=UPI003F5786DB